MYTFILLILVSFLITAIIYRKNIRQHQMAVVLIIFSIILIGSIIVNGILGLKIPLTQTIMREKLLEKKETSIIYNDKSKRDTTFESYLKFTFEIDREDSTEIDTSVSISFRGSFWYKSDLKKDKIRIRFLPKGDTISRYQIIRGIRKTDSKWIANITLPRGPRIFVIYLPKDSLHVYLMNQIKEKLYDFKE